MPIKLKSTGGGSVTLDVPSTASDFTLYVPANNATLASSNGASFSNSTFSNSTFSNSSIAYANVTTDLVLSVSPFLKMTPNVTSDYTISNTYNHLSIGPLTVANGVNVTVSNGATWVVV